ncbi:addiction module HigA family antidote [Saccharopolyspora lacisalsi]|uniref:Addiction module HigA family antidote n=2 Tax=Halosaccharopolyspora lacisalsi TaxID=1000566 RepID=A0A839DWH4_9PSEU|nr:addiction module HigA family antidote [Halosaccharopolyspora lacisalsi]
MILHAAETLEDLRTPPGKRLEKLKGDRAGQYSIRIDRQWRLCFCWTDLGPVEVGITAYHQETAVDTDIVMPPVHPGEILDEEYLQPLDVSQYRLAVETGVPPRRINEIVHGTRRISADTALRMARYFGTSERFFLDRRELYDLEVEKDRIGSELDRTTPLRHAC